MAQEVDKYDVNTTIFLKNSSNKEFQDDVIDNYLNNKANISESAIDINNTELSDYINNDEIRKCGISSVGDIEMELPSFEVQVKMANKICGADIEAESCNKLPHSSHCHESYEDYCTKCTILVQILNKTSPHNTSNKIREFPENILEIRKSFGHLGIFTLKVVPESVMFGPFTGLKPAGLPLKIKAGRFIVNDDQFEYLNWMQHINPARNISEQNLCPFKYEDKLYYCSTRIILKDEELLVYFGEEYEDNLKNVEMDFVPNTKQVVENVFGCTFCCLGFRSMEHLTEHKTVRHSEANEIFLIKEIALCPFCKIYFEKKEYFEYHKDCCEKTNREANFVRNAGMNCIMGQSAELNNSRERQSDLMYPVQTNVPSVIMPAERRARKRPLLDEVNKFIGKYPDLKYNGAKISCTVCKKDLMCWDQRDCRKHINTGAHIRNKRTDVPPHAEFKFDITCMLLACNLPLNLLDQEPFHQFWNKYNASLKLPCRRTLQRIVPTVHEKMKNKMKSELANKKLWLCVDETTDIKKHSIVNVIVRILDPLKSSPPLLLACKKLELCNGEAITTLVQDTLAQFELSTQQLLMFVSVGGSRMRCVGRALKKQNKNLLHITCKIHAFHLVTETIRKFYPEVDALIASTKTVICKSSKRTREFHRRWPHIRKPPHPILTHWGTWLQAALYYCKYFEQIKSAVSHFNPREAEAIKISQTKFQDSHIERDLQTIQRNYSGLAEAIDNLQNPSASLEDSLKIVDDVRSLLGAASDEKKDRVVTKLESVLKEDPDFSTLRQICACTDPSSNFKDYFNYANITSLDVEQSFSAYKNILSSRRTRLADTNVETYLMLQFFFRSHPLSDNKS